MQFLILTILVSAGIYVIFKLFGVYKINTLQAIVVNYLVCSVMGVLFTGVDQMSAVMQYITPALPYAITLGGLFILVFNFIALTSQKFGVGVTSIADKLSLIIPVVFAFFLYQDAVTVYKVVGILLAIVAVFLAVSKKENAHHENLVRIWYYPVVVFVGAGIISTLLKEVQFKFESLNYNAFLIFLFGVAFVLGFIFLMFQVLRGKSKLDVKSVIGGVLLGIPNYFSMYFLLKTLNTPNWESSIVFPVLNIGIVLTTSMIGLLAFNERLSRKNWLGLLLAIFGVAILLIERLYV